jgi:2-oxoglutarate ferredoxin oxidoreductase subunit gamma
MSNKKTRTEIRLSGFGGQGIMLAGMVLGKAAAVNEGRNAMMAQSYGPESRGGASVAEIIIDDGEIDYPRVINPDAIMVLSQEAYKKYGADRSKETLLIAEKDLVTLDPKAESGKKAIRVPCTALAEKVDRRIVMNMVALGALCRATGAVSVDALKKAIADSVPKGTEAKNLLAFEEGYNYLSEPSVENSEAL